MTDISPIPPAPATGLQPGPAPRDTALRSVARDLEASFLAEMLKYTGAARPPEGFGGGPGEDAFAGFLTEAYAAELAEAGGIGLAESIFQALVAREQAR